LQSTSFSAAFFGAQEMEYREGLKFIGSYCRLLFFGFLSVIGFEDFCNIGFVAQSLTLRRKTDQLPLPGTFTIQTPIADTLTGSLC
jgi:hypothetical protein